MYGTRVKLPERMVTVSGTYRILTDHLGSPRLVVDSTIGAIAQRVGCDEWGVVLADSNPGFQPFGFAGGLYDRDTGLVSGGSLRRTRGGRWRVASRGRGPGRAPQRERACGRMPDQGRTDATACAARLGPRQEGAVAARGARHCTAVCGRRPAAGRRP